MNVVTEIDGWAADENPAAAVVTGCDPAVDVCTPEALDLVARLCRAHGHSREALIARRTERIRVLRATGTTQHRASTASIADREWQVAPPPADLVDRRCEITGPADRKMIISAMNSGARVFMADLEDSLSPTWSNIVAGHRNLRDAANGSISFDRGDGSVDTLLPEHATLVVRPRGLHLLEPRIDSDHRSVAASIFDVAMLGLHMAKSCTLRGAGLYLYLPKIESSFEAQWWDALLADVERRCGLGPNSIRVSVLIETVPAACEMEEILFALRERVTALNAGRWDYLFSMIKVLGPDRERALADREDLTMTTPFMAEYAERIVEVCHRRGAHAIGGMSAFVPDRRDELMNQRAFTAVLDDKAREAALGYDGAWVAHPDLVPIVTSVFDRVLGRKPHQIERLPSASRIGIELVDTTTRGGGYTYAAAERNIQIAHEYLASWLEGRGAVAIDHRMEDLATAEVSRAQIWQWLHSGMKLDVAGDAPIVLDQAIISTLLADSGQSLASTHRRQAIQEAGRILMLAISSPDLPPFLSTLALSTLDALAAKEL